MASGLNGGPYSEPAKILRYNNESILYQIELDQEAKATISVKGTVPYHRVGELLSRRTDDGGWDPLGPDEEVEHFIGTSIHDYSGPDRLSHINDISSELEDIQEQLPYTNADISR